MDTAKLTAAHSPGPWSVIVAELPYFSEASIVDATGIEIGFLYASDGSDEPAPLPTKANARLIAAAPELLEALKGVVRVADRRTVEFDAARAAIAAATGEG